MAVERLHQRRQRGEPAVQPHQRLQCVHVCRGLEIIHPSLQRKADGDEPPDITVCIGSAIVNVIKSFAINANENEKNKTKKQKHK